MLDPNDAAGDAFAGQQACQPHCVEVQRKRTPRLQMAERVGRRIDVGGGAPRQNHAVAFAGACGKGDVGLGPGAVGVKEGDVRLGRDLVGEGVVVRRPIAVPVRVLEAVLDCRTGLAHQSRHRNADRIEESSHELWRCPFTNTEDAGFLALHHRDARARQELPRHQRAHPTRGAASHHHDVAHAGLGTPRRPCERVRWHPTRATGIVQKALFVGFVS